jgi:hypothetical protein
MNTVELLLYVAGGVLGIVAVLEAQGRSWAGWGVALLALALVLGRLA